jgi:hypothetical protein
MSEPTLVAITTRPRAPDLFSQFPMIVSDSPPLWPGTQTEYTSAVSMRFSPEAANRLAITAFQDGRTDRGINMPQGRAVTAVAAA